MHSTRTLLAVASITSCLTHGAEGFLVSLYNTIPSQQQLHTTRLGSRRCTRTRGTAAPGQHDSTTTTAVTSLSRRLCHTHLHTRTNSGLVVMAAAAKKRRRRKDTPSTPPSDNNKESAKSAPSPPEPAAVTPSAKAEGEAPESASGDESKAKERGEATRALVEVQQGMRPVTDLFTDDWSGMQANDGMVKSKMDLPDLADYVPKQREEAETFEQRTKKTAVGLTIGEVSPEKRTSPLQNIDSKLSPLVDREKEAALKRKAETFEEGPVVKALKTATWCCVVALVAWEVYINSPFFPAPTPPPI